MGRSKPNKIIILLFFLSSGIFSRANIDIDSIYQQRYKRTLNDSVFEVGDLIQCPEIRFDLDNGLRVDQLFSHDSIRKIVNFFVSNPLLIAEIICHTDTRGSYESNQSLSLNRAISLTSYILNHFNSDTVFSERFRAVGKGESNPLISEEIINAFKSDNALFEFYHQVNRRFEIKIRQHQRR